MTMILTAMRAARMSGIALGINLFSVIKTRNARYDVKYSFWDYT
jgi:hypothetical protein